MRGGTLPCGESGSTFRFLLPVVGALGRKASFILEGRLPERPLSPLYEELVRHGCKLSPQGANPFTIEGQLTPGSYTLDGGVSSQFISGLLFALPLLGGDSTISLTGKAESLPYIEMTLDTLKTFQINIGYDGKAFTIPGRQKYISPGTVQVEGDWSNAAFWLCAGAVSGNTVTVTGLDPHSKQGDRAVAEILGRFGKDLHGIEIDAANIPDLVPILSVVAAAAKGPTRIYNAGRLRDKESDRLAAIRDVLGKLGADIRETEDGLVINGGKPLTGGTVSSWGDHRIAMSAAIAAVLCAGPVIIQGAEAADKSYPTFFDERRRLECPHNTGKI
jgi:3-phosphoshikimate 1-carboxyvinyltransferase